MTKSHELSMFERGMIIGLYKGSHTVTDISRILKIPRSTCDNIVKKFNRDQTVSPDSRPGRPPLLKAIDKRQFIRTAVANRKDSVEEITEKFNNLGLTEISTKTARRVLHEHGYFGRVGRRKPLVSEDNRKKRLRWCKERRQWDEEWDNVIWSDESRFLLFENDGRHRVWRKPHEQYDVDCIFPTVKSGGKGIMVWGCFTKERLGPLIVVDGTITANTYKKLLEEHLLDFMESLDDDIAYIFQDDNAPVHRAKSVIEWKEEILISSLPWPAQSPDLNPIEHLWDILGRKVHEHKPHPKNLTELSNVLQSEWLKISNNDLEKLVNSMPRRVGAVIKNKGYPTEY